MLLPLVACIALQVPEIEIHRAWTVISGDNTSVAGVRDGLVYASAWDKVFAIREKDGAEAWSLPLESKINNAMLVGDNLIVASKDTGRWKLTSFSTHPPKKLASTMLEKDCLAMDVAGRQLVTLNARGVLNFYGGGLKVQRTLNTGLAINDEAYNASILMEGNTLVLGVEGGGFTAWDVSSGKQLWAKRDKYPSLYYNEAEDGQVLLHGEHQGVYDLKTGGLLWKLGESLEWHRVHQGVLLAEVSDQVTAYNWKSGKVLWTMPGSEGSYLAEEGSIVTLGPDGNSFLVDLPSSKPLRWLGVDGEVKGQFSQGGVINANPSTWVMFDGQRIFGFGPGKQPPLPTDPESRRAFALRQVAKYEVLSRPECEQLIELKEFATKPLLKRFPEWTRQQRDEEREHDPLGYFRYSLVDDLWQLLNKMVTKDDTADLIEAMKDTGMGSWWSERPLASMLERVGDETLVVPFILNHLRETSRNPPPGFEPDSSYSIIAKSKHPDAVKFFIEVLGDSKAPSDWRRCAFQHLAGTGGAAGVAAVKAAFPKGGAMKPWTQQIELEAQGKSKDAKIAQDKKGRRWMLFFSAVLGNQSDPFIVQKTKEGWGTPLFLGFHTERVWDQMPPETVRGVPLEQMLKTEWVKVYPDDPGIRLDSDKDGLTNLVEKRLGTHPDLRDTDKDGLFDAVDPCPNAAPRTLGDKEKIVQAVLATRFFEEDWGTPGLISAEGVEPFQVVGYSRVLMWGGRSEGAALGRAYGGGVNLISFGGPGGPDSSSPWLSISPDGKTARTLISRYSGGLNGDGVEAELIKVGEDWFVVHLQVRYVS